VASSIRQKVHAHTWNSGLITIFGFSCVKLQKRCYEQKRIYIYVYTLAFNKYCATYTHTHTDTGSCYFSETNCEPRKPLPLSYPQSKRYHYTQLLCSIDTKSCVCIKWLKKRGGCVCKFAKRCFEYMRRKSVASHTHTHTQCTL